MRNIIKNIEYLQKMILYVSAVLMASLAIIVFYEVFSRYVLNSPTIWVNEISSYILQFIVFFSMGHLLIEDEHIKVTFFIDRLKGRASKIFRIVNIALIFPYATILLIYGWKITVSSYERASVSPTLLAIPLWIPYSFVFIGGGLLILGGFCSILKIIINDQDTSIASKGREIID